MPCVADSVDDREIPAGVVACGFAVAPPSKSVAIRALVCAALSRRGVTTRIGLPAGDLPDDVACAAEALRGLGVAIGRAGAARGAMQDVGLVVEGTGGAVAAGAGAVSVGGSATALRFLAAVAALGAGPTTIGGTTQLLRRPAGAVVPALRSLGVSVKGQCGASRGPTPPLVIAGGPPRRGEVVVDAAESSHAVSALMLIGPMLAGGLRVRAAGDSVASRPYIELTCEVMRAFGAQVSTPVDSAGATWDVAGGGYGGSAGGVFDVEGDWSSAAYLLAAAAATGGEVVVPNVRATSRQADRAVLDVLRAFGAEAGTDAASGGARCAGRITRAVEVDLADAPDLAPLVGALACLAPGRSVVRGAPHLRIKETDRIASVVRCARALGCAAEERDDGFVIEGGGARGAVIEPEGDHRLAMAFAVAGLAIPGTRIAEPSCVAKSFPSFWQTIDAILCRSAAS